MAATNVDSALVNGAVYSSGSPYNATLSEVLAIEMTVTKSGGGNWRSYGATVGGVTTCINQTSPANGTYVVNFNSGVPATAGTYDIIFETFTNVACGGAGGTLTWTGAVVAKTNQTITFGAQGAQTYSPGGSFPISPLATASSGLPVAYSTLTPAVCTIAGTTVTIVTAGTCSIAANQAGDGSYHPAAQVTQNITINKANQTITFGAQAAQTYAPAGTFALSPVATTTSGLAITYTSTTPAVCSIVGTTVTIVTAGTCTIAANQAGNTNYNAAAQVTQNITINKANQAVLTVTAPASATFGTPETLTSSGGSGTGALSYSHGASTGCTASGTTLTVTDASGSCSVTATKAADTNYNATTSAAFTVTLNKANQTIGAIGFTPATLAVGNTTTASATATSGLAVTFSSTTPAICTSSGANGATITGVAVGTCTVAANQAGDTNFNAAPQLTQNIAVTAAVGSFNACEPAAPQCTPTAPPALGYAVLRTKLAGTSFSLEGVALKADGTLESTFSGSVTADLVANINTGVSLGADNCPSSQDATIALGSASFSSGRATASGVVAANAFRDVRLRFTCAPAVCGSTITTCSTDNFAIRPDNFTLTATDNDWETAGTTNSLANTVASGGVVHKAGRNFTLTANAWNGAGIPALTTNYTGTPTMTLSPCGGTGCTGSFGTLAPGVTSFTAGNLTSNTATYNDVGAFNLTLEDTDFASVDAADGTPADCSATGRYVCSAATAVGRFVPDHFETDFTTGPMNCGALPFAPACPLPGSYLAYSGQSFTLRVRAYALGGTGGAGLTTNYAGAIAKDVTLTAWDAMGSTTLLNQNPPASGGALTGDSVLAASFTAGDATAAPVYTFTANPTAPTNVYFRAIDAESVSSLNAVPASSVEGGIKVVSGRMQIENMYGPPTSRLGAKVRALYWGGTQWALNTSDTVSGAATGNFALGDHGACVTPTFCGITLFSAGALSGADGEFRVVLTPPTSGSGRRSVLLNSSLPYLSGSGRQTWGSFRAPYIHQQER
jgi:hypothetical protein